jgi:NAD(P)-dependent dehydrogenase (short-subunit alcohol dehydrogenase family)
MVRKWEKLGKPKPAESVPMGSIIFIGSVATHISTYVQQISCYTASKAAIGGLVKPMAMELAQYGIRVNSLSPGSMRTDMFLQVEIGKSIIGA